MTGRRQSKKASNSKENKNQIQIDITKLVDDGVKAWKSEYMQEISILKAELVELKDSQKFICSQYDDLKQDYDHLLLTIVLSFSSLPLYPPVTFTASHIIIPITYYYTYTPSY